MWLAVRKISQKFEKKRFDVDKGVEWDMRCRGVKGRSCRKVLNGIEKR